MLNAIDRRGLPVDPTPGLHALCGLCNGEVQSKVGSIVIPHFAHMPGHGQDCAQWEWEPESHWHRWWKSRVPRENREIVFRPSSWGGERILDTLPRVIGGELIPEADRQKMADILRRHPAQSQLGPARRADLVTWEGMILELQNSRLSPEEIQAREEFYRTVQLPPRLRGEAKEYMSWLFNVESAAQDNRLTLQPGSSGAHNPFRYLRWKHVRKHIAFAAVPTYLDLGILERPRSIFELRELDPDFGTGHGVLLDREEFIQRVIWPRDYVRLPPLAGRNCPDHPTYPLVQKESGDWCRRGQHYLPGAF